MTEYSKKVEFLKGLIETQKMVRQINVLKSEDTHLLLHSNGKIIV